MAEGILIDQLINVPTSSSSSSLTINVQVPCAVPLPKPEKGDCGAQLPVIVEFPVGKAEPPVINVQL